MVKVSVIIPVYKTEQYVSKTIESVLNQTLSDIEVIIINDGSPDNSDLIISNFNDRRIKYFHTKNRGVAKARELGIEKASGEYLYFLDSDDFIEENTLELAYTKASQDDLDMLEFRFIYYYDSNGKTKKSKYLLTDSKSEFIAKGQMIPGDKIFKREIVTNNNIKFPPDIYYEDIVFSVIFVMNSKKIGYLDKGLMYYRQRDNQITKSINAKKILDIISSLNLVLEYSKQNNYYDEFKLELEYLVARIIQCSSFKRIVQIEDKTTRLDTYTKTYNFLVDNFPNYKDNKYLKEFSLKNIFIKILNPSNVLFWSIFC